MVPLGLTPANSNTAGLLLVRRNRALAGPTERLLAIFWGLDAGLGRSSTDTTTLTDFCLVLPGSDRPSLRERYLVGVGYGIEIGRAHV